ncbi:hypothetical protein AB205_0215190, partial [Aquarana catesbeiana]
IKNRFSAGYVSLPDQNKIWTLTVSPELREKTPLVMVHGFGGGIGLWIQNIDRLSSRRALYAFDLLGFGRSSRPTFPSDPEAAEELFVSSIEQVKHLILVDPWGFPALPTDPSEVRSPPAWVKAIAAVLGRSNPLAVVRAAGPWVGWRIAGLFAMYLCTWCKIYHELFLYVPVSGESAFKTMMERFGWAKRPMLPRLNLIPKSLPITFIYGAETWIDSSTGEKAKELRPDSYVHTLAIKGASHHVYADQPSIFNEVVDEICDAVD